ncbi:MAG: C4-type zinc ribbon domain-containing protein [Dehalococcoidia bacterium]
MVQAKGLVEFQDIDSHIDEGKKRLAEVQSQLKETNDLQAARAELQLQEQRTRELQAQQKSLELDVEQTRTRIGDLEARIMGNQVSTRDLPNVDREVGNLRQRQSSLEDTVLALMEDVDGARATLDEQAKAVAELEGQWKESQAHLVEEKRRIEAELPQWEARRQQFAASLNEPARRLYERVRAKKGGQAVARVEGGICTGCRISLPSTLVQRARIGKEVVYCSSCGRILYVE